MPIDWSDIAVEERRQVTAHIRRNAWRPMPGWGWPWLRIACVSIPSLVVFEGVYLYLASKGIVHIGMFDGILPHWWTQRSFRWLNGAGGITLAYGFFFIYVVTLPYLLKPFFLVRFFYKERVAEAFRSIGRCGGCGYRLVDPGTKECPECGESRI